MFLFSKEVNMTIEQCKKCSLKEYIISGIVIYSFCKLVFNVYEFNEDSIICRDFIWNGELSK